VNREIDTASFQLIKSPSRPGGPPAALIRRDRAAIATTDRCSCPRRNRRTPSGPQLAKLDTERRHAPGARANGAGQAPGPGLMTAAGNRPHHRVRPPTTPANLDPGRPAGHGQADAAAATTANRGLRIRGPAAGHRDCGYALRPAERHHAVLADRTGQQALPAPIRSKLQRVFNSRAGSAVTHPESARTTPRRPSSRPRNLAPPWRSGSTNPPT